MDGKRLVRIDRSKTCRSRWRSSFKLTSSQYDAAEMALGGRLDDAPVPPGPSGHLVLHHSGRRRRGVLLRPRRGRHEDGYVKLSPQKNRTRIQILLIIPSFKGLVFEIAEGGFLDIDVKIMDPAGNIIYQGERESSGKFTFAAHTEGKYTYCFSNKMSTMTPKVDFFWWFCIKIWCLY